MTEKEEIEALTAMVAKLTDQLNKALTVIADNYQQHITSELKPITTKAILPNGHYLN